VDELKTDQDEQREQLSQRLLQGMLEHHNTPHCNQCVQEFGRLYASKIRAWIRQKSSTLDDHEVAVLQNLVLYKVWRSAGTYNGSSLVSTWLYQITKNTVIDHHRQGRKEVQLPEDWFGDTDLSEDFEAFSGHSESPEAWHSRQEYMRELNDCVANLSEKDNKTLTLVFLEALPYEEVAERLETKIGTVKSRVNGIREKLSLCMQGKSLGDWFSIFS
jgi:RNA polymerase sigma-70 factor, ECF subfamily